MRALRLRIAGALAIPRLKNRTFRWNDTMEARMATVHAFANVDC
jgi:hypothetical protein